MNNSYSGNFFQSPLSGKSTQAATPKKTQKKLPRNIDIFEYLEDPSLTLLREDMLRAKSFDSVSTQDLERLYWHLRDYSYYCGRISNYDEALETEKLLEYVFLELKDRKSQFKSQVYSEILNPTFFQNQQMKWMQQLINFDQETEKKVESIKDRHISEIKLLESRWKQSRLRPYNKLSPSLRDLANNEQTASTAGDFATARSIHDDIECKRKEELKDAQYRADAEYNSILTSLKQRQTAELDNFLDTRLHKRELLIRKQQNDLDTIEDKANISLYRMNNNKPFQSSEVSLPFRGLIRPFIQTNQLNVNSNSPKLLPPIRPPPLKNENWSPQKLSDKKKVIKCVPKTRHKVDFQNNEFDLMNAMEILKRRFSKMTQEKNDENEKNTASSNKRKKKNDDDDLFDFNAYYENQRNPAHLKLHEKKKKKKEDETVIKQQPYFEPVKRKMNFESIMKKVREKEANKRKPPVIHSKRKPLRPPKRTNKFNSEEEEEEYEDDFNENESNIQFKQKVDVTASKIDAYDRIIDEKNKTSNKNNGKKEDIIKEKKKSEESEIKSIEIVKKGRSKPTEKYFSFKEKDKNELKLFFCEQDKNIVNEFNSSYDSYSSSNHEAALIKNITNGNLSEKGKNSSSVKKLHKKISTKKSSDGVERDYSYSSYYYNYSEYSIGETENAFKDRDGNDVFIIKGDIPQENPYHGNKLKKEYSKIVKVDYDYTNIKNEYEEEVEEEEEKVKNKRRKKRSHSKSKSRPKNHEDIKKIAKNEEKEDQENQESDKIQKGDSQNVTKSKKSKKSKSKHKKSKKSNKKSFNNSNTIVSSSSSNLSSSSANSSDKINPNDIQSHHKQSDKSSDNDESSIITVQNDSQVQNHTENTTKSSSTSEDSNNPSPKSTETKNIQKKTNQNEPASPSKHKTKKHDKSHQQQNQNNDISHQQQEQEESEEESHTESDSIETENNHHHPTDHHHHHHKSHPSTKKKIHRNDRKNDEKTNNSSDSSTSSRPNSPSSIKNPQSILKIHSSSCSDSNNNDHITNKEEEGDIVSNDKNESKRKSFSYSKVSHISIKSDKKKQTNLEDASESLYVPKLQLSSVFPLEKKDKEKKKKEKHTKISSSPKDRFQTPKLNQINGLSSAGDDDNDEIKDDRLISKQARNRGGGRNIAKRSATSKISPKILNNGISPLNDGSLFGAGVETKSSGVVKIKH